MANTSGLKRSSKYGVGKEIGGAVYVHRTYEHLLGPEIDVARNRLPADFRYTVVKYALRRGSVTFIASPDFDTAHEPIVGDLWIVHPEGTTSFRRQLPDPWIYHHKWLMVLDDYQGFDVEASKKRSAQLDLLPDVDRKLIGRSSYWLREVAPRLADPEELIQNAIS